jgi:adenylate cyclase
MLDDPDISIDATADSLGVARPRDIEEGYYSLQYIVGRSSTVPAQDHPLLFNLLIVDGKPVYLQDFEDAVLFHGITATGGHDRNPIPYETRYPMVGLHVNVLNSILTEQFLHQLPRWATFLLIVGIGLLMGVVVPRMQAGLVAAVLVVVLIGYGVLALVLFSKQGIIIEVVGPMGTAVVSFLAITVSRYIQEEKEKRYIKDAFSSYLAPEVVAQLVDDPSRLQLGGDRKIITILFTDVAGFSTVSEALTAEELVILLNEYLTAMCDIIFKYGGTVDKFEGDLIMAFFGAPIEYEDHASRACQASLEMNTKLAEMREVWRKQGRHELYARIGLNTGGAVVGNMGSNQRMDYTVMGDSVNVASRLEGGNKPYGTYLMISADTYEMAKDDIEVRQLDMVTVVGRKEPVAVYEVLSLAGELDPDLARVREIYQAAHALYQDQQWTAAMLMFDEAISINDDPPSNTLKDRCESILRHEIEIPQRWDGVWELTEK